MKEIYKEETIKIPREVKLDLEGRKVRVEGPRGVLIKDFGHINVELKRVNKFTIKVIVWHGGRKHIACIRTVMGHINNMIVGVTKGYLYKMRYVYAHFPINVVISDDGKDVEIRNFLGEKVIRKVKLLEGVSIEISKDNKDEILLTGNNLENVSLSCALIQQSTTVKRKDIRKFLDGIYVSQRTTIVQE